MTSHPICVHFEKYRLSRVANAFARVLGCRNDSVDIIAIHSHRVDSVPRSPVADVIDTHRFASMHECLPLVVFADKKDWKIPYGSEIKRFVKNAFACRTVTEENRDDAVLSEYRLG